MSDESRLGFETRILIQQARNGASTSLGELLESCRRYLLLLAEDGLDADLHAKFGASDLVQEAMLEAQRDFSGFRGESRAQLLAWLSRILLNNLLNHSRDYRLTQKRQLSREQPLNGTDVGAKELDLSTPSDRVVRKEEEALLNAALTTLSEEQRQVIELRHREHRSFVEIGEIMGRSSDAARMLWWRAFEKLSTELDGHK